MQNDFKLKQAEKLSSFDLMSLPAQKKQPEILAQKSLNNQGIILRKTSYDNDHVRKLSFFHNKEDINYLLQLSLEKIEQLRHSQPDNYRDISLAYLEIASLYEKNEASGRCEYYKNKAFDLLEISLITGTLNCIDFTCGVLPAEEINSLYASAIDSLRENGLGESPRASYLVNKMTS